MARYLGLMSGTSLDGVDAALVEIEPGDDGRPHARLQAFHSIPYTADRRAAIEAAIRGGPAELCRLNRDLGEWFAEAALSLLADAGVAPGALAAIGSHGQTIWHEPPAGGRPGATLQLGDSAIIAERVGRPVISDFRARDVAAGGHGAPLVPRVDQLLFGVAGRYRALQNIGGIANVTRLPPEGSSEPVIAFDTGPGVAVIDAVVGIVTGGSERFDRGGTRAARGRVHDGLLDELLADPYFAAPPPKSTGREHFGAHYARDLTDRGRAAGLDDDDLVATATALTARSIGDAYQRFLTPDLPDECIVSGGGARNPTLMRMLAEAVRPVPVSDLSGLGWDPDAKEAAAFAVLAWLFQRGEPGNLPSVTGARGPRILGKLTPP